MDVRVALRSQYHAALAMLKQAIERCPEGLWAGDSYPVPFWRVAYHTLYYTHLYLQQREETFVPWEHHRAEYHDLPRPTDRVPTIADPYTKAQLLEYWRFCDALVNTAMQVLDLDAEDCGISWHKGMPKLEHQLHNLRHVQHHAALLAGRLRLADGTEVRWVRSG